jgi:hypothetical protein
MVARILLVIVSFGLIAATALYPGIVQVPERFNPWTTLNIQAKPNFLTRYKLARLSKDPALCRQVLATTAFRYQLLADRQMGSGCGFHNAVRIDRTDVDIGEPFSLSCRAAVSVALWERHVLQPAAQSSFGQRIERIEHFGSYACRNVYGRAQATRSRHATAEALDIAGFVFTDGRRLRVLKDWSADATDAAFLRTVRDGACTFFDGVLSPDYNAAHRDHFHLDRGPYRICR